MAKQETTITNLKINRGTYEAIQANLSQIGENELIITTDKNVPIPDVNDAGKIIKIDSSGDYELSAETDTWRNIKVNGTEKLGTGTNTGALDLQQGTNVSITESSGVVTISATDTTYSLATTSSNGLLRQLESSSVATQTQSTKFLREDGTWAIPSYTTQVDVEANPVDEATVALTKLKVDNIIYSISGGGGTSVVANPTIVTPPDYDLNNIQIDNTIYRVKQFNTTDTSYGQLNTPILNIIGNTLEISNVPNATNYDIYIDDIFKATSSLSTVNLKSIFSENGTFDISVVARATNYTDSEESTSETYTVSWYPTVKSELSYYSWAEIKILADAVALGALTETDLSTIYNISIGDTKAILINDENHGARLIGLAHDVDENDNVIGMTFEQTDLMANTYVMKSNMTDEDSWANSDLKTTINAFTITSDLDSVITPAKKPCYVSVSNPFNIIYVTSKLWLESTAEVFGTSMFNTEGTQYTYYINGGSKIKSNKRWWLRTPYEWNSYNNRSLFENVDEYGDQQIGGIFASSSLYIAPCFCI